MNDQKNEEVEIRTGLKAGENGQMGTGSAVDNGQMGSGNAAPGGGTVGSGH